MVNTYERYLELMQALRRTPITEHAWKGLSLKTRVDMMVELREMARQAGAKPGARKPHKIKTEGAGAW